MLARSSLFVIDPHPRSCQILPLASANHLTVFCTVEDIGPEKNPSLKTFSRMYEMQKAQMLMEINGKIASGLFAASDCTELARSCINVIYKLMHNKIICIH